MILMDFSQIILATMFVQLKGHTNALIEEGMMRHMVLNSIRSNYVKFRKEYGELVICFDSKQCWRKDVFPYYKARRAEGKEGADIDWKAIYSHLNTIKAELKTFFPYKTLEVEGAEADDLIAAMCHKFGTQLGGEDILILSGDKDFAQLQKFANVKQWDPINKRWIVTSNPEFNLFSLICKGDGGDDVPNIRSQADSFMLKIRQKPISEKALAEWFANKKVPEDCQARFEQNTTLIDLSKTPKRIVDEAIRQYEECKPASRAGLMDFFIHNKLKLLLSDIGDF